MPILLILAWHRDPALSLGQCREVTASSEIARAVCDVNTVAAVETSGVKEPSTAKFCHVLPRSPRYPLDSHPFNGDKPGQRKKTFRCPDHVAAPTSLHAITASRRTIRDKYSTLSHIPMTRLAETVTGAIGKVSCSKSRGRRVMHVSYHVPIDCQ